MIHDRGFRTVLGLALLLALRLSGCATPAAGSEAEEHGRPAPATVARDEDPQPDRRAGATPEAEAQRILHALFPEIQGEITRASIAQALAPETARATPPPAPSGSTLAGTPDSKEVRRLQAWTAIQAGDYEGARLILGGLLVEEQLAHARELLATGDARGALATLDRAIEIAPRNARARCLRGAAGLRVGAEDGERGLIEAALADFLAAAREEDSAAAWMGASRSARTLKDMDAALEYARNGMRAWKRNEAGPPLEVPPEHTLVDAAFDAYRVARSAGGGDTQPPSAEAVHARELFLECKQALESLIVRIPGDAWAWQRLSALYQSEGSLSEAQSIALRGLNEAPSDEGLHQRLADASSALGGRAGLLAVYADFNAAHPKVALGEWYPAVAQFDTAVEALLAVGREAGARAELTSAQKASLGAASGAFQSAEKSFARCRALDGRYAAACLAYERLCRDGAGWCAYDAGDLDAAQAAFLSMEDLGPGGLAAELAEKLSSGILGLHSVGAAYAARAQKENSLASLENLERAGKVYDFLHEYQPENSTWANDSGFFNRDTAVALERKAQAIADQGQIDEANRLLDRARELMDKSYRAYVDAARLEPDDVRIQNDTGLILTYYLQRDIERAEAYLERARELGEKQVPELREQSKAPGLSAEERDARKRKLEYVESALGDAYQNLGVLALTLKGDPQAARAWFEKCLATGQDPREEVSGKGGYLEQCADAVAGRRNPLVTDKTRWGARKASQTEKKTN
jgi:tetratricopeptide (TPR) repeat protein